jgi:hypothetical protein
VVAPSYAFEALKVHAFDIEPRHYDALIAQTEEGSQLRANDAIVAVGGERTLDAMHLLEQLKRSLQQSPRVALDVSRNGSVVHLQLELPALRRQDEGVSNRRSWEKK